MLSSTSGDCLWISLRLYRSLQVMRCSGGDRHISGREQEGYYR